MTEPLDLRGRVALVTGGARGIGRGIVDGLLAAGADVATCGRNQPDDLPDGVAFVATDVREADQVDALVDAVVQRFGRLDVAVNNGGGSPTADAATASPRFSTGIVTLNLLAPLFVAQAANRVMQGQDEGGCIISIGSLSGLRPSPGTAAYGAATAGLVHLTQSLAVEWAPRVRVNCVSAGRIATDGDEAAVARVAATVPMGRPGSPTDVADAVVYLASPLARYVTGANLVLDGGGELPAYLAAVEGAS
jgi:NAD(P)-dependent dehydrogenase (short-subunit alcohol dehydrogenase family)